VAVKRHALHLAIQFSFQTHGAHVILLPTPRVQDADGRDFLATEKVSSDTAKKIRFHVCALRLVLGVSG
jgi:hypothetical protein